MFDTNTGEILQQFEGHHGSIKSLSWKPNGLQFASASPDDGLVRVWDTNGKQIVELSGVRSPEGLAFVKWNPNGDWLAAVAAITDGGSPLQIWNTQDDQYQLLPTTYNVAAYDMAWSPDGTKLAVADYNGVYIFTDFSSEGVEPLPLATFAFTIAWSPDGSQLAAANTIGLIRILDITTGQLLNSFQGVARDAQHGISNISWSPDGHLLASDDYDGTTQIWDVQNGELIETLTATRSGWRGLLSWSPDGGRLALGDVGANDVSALTDTPQTRQENGLRLLANGAVQIVVPAPSLERLAEIGDACGLPTEAAQSLTASRGEEALSAFTASIQALPADAIPPACAADLLAVAEALQETG